MSFYEIKINPSAVKALEKLEKSLRRRITEKIILLSKNPRPSGSIKLKGEEAYRIRIGDYRVIYEIYDKTLMVIVVKISHRRDAYE